MSSPEGNHEQRQSQERPTIGIDLDVLIIGLFVSDEYLSVPILVVGVDGHDDLIEDIEQRHQLITFVWRRIAEQDLQGCSHTIRLHLAEEAALLTLYAIEDVTNIMDVFLVLLYLGIVPSEELEALLLLATEVVPLQRAQQIRQQGLRLQVRCDVI